MNKVFRILWIEDAQDWFETEEEHVKEMIEAHLLIPSIDRGLGNSVQDKRLESNQYDLILIDYKLVNGLRGDEFIRQIRNHQIVTDILFYSSNISSLLESLSGGEDYLDGVYICDRNNEVFEIKVEKLIQKVVRRSEDIVNLRGFVLDNTSEFENRVETILNAYWERADSLQRDKLRKKTKALYEDKYNSLVNVKTAVEDVGNFQFQEHNNRHDILGIQDRARLLKDCSGLFENVDFGDFPHFVEFYQRKIGDYRNGLGHARCDDEIIIVNKEEIPIDEDLFKTLRKNILEVGEVLCSIEENLENSHN